jgi:hypothetical protein
MGDVACVSSVGIERLILRSAEGASRRMSSSNRIVARPFVPAGAPFEAALRRLRARRGMGDAQVACFT